MIDIVTYDPAHLDSIKPRYIYENDKTMKDRLNFKPDDKHLWGYTMMDDNKPIAIIGAHVNTTVINKTKTTNP